MGEGFDAFCVSCMEQVSRTDFRYVEGRIFHRKCYEEHGAGFGVADSNLAEEAAKIKIEIMGLRKKLGTPRRKGVRRPAKKTAKRKTARTKRARRSSVRRTKTVRRKSAKKARRKVRPFAKKTKVRRRPARVSRRPKRAGRTISRKTVRRKSARRR